MCKLATFYLLFKGGGESRFSPLKKPPGSYLLKDDMLKNFMGYTTLKKLITQFLVFIFFLIGVSHAVNASNLNKKSNADPDLISNSPSVFDSTSANQLLNELNTEDFLNASNIRALQSAINHLSKFELQAKKCIEIDSTELEKINKQLEDIVPTQTKNNTPNPEQKYLDLKKKQMANELSACRLFVLRADEILNRLSQQLRLKVKTRLFYAEPDLFNNLSQLPAETEFSVKTFEPTLWLEQSGIQSLKLWQWIFLVLLINLSIFLANRLKKSMILLIGHKRQEKFPENLKQIIFSVLKKYISYFLPILTFSACFTLFALLTTHSDHFPFIILMSYGLIIHLFFMMLIQFYFYPPPPAGSYSHIPEFLAKKLTRRLHAFGWLVLSAYFSYLMLRNQILSDSILSVLKTFFMTLFSINLISIVWLAKKLPKIAYQFHFLRHLISIALSIALASILIAQWAGYHLLAEYLLYGVVFTTIASFVARLLSRMITVGIQNLNAGELSWQLKFRRYFNVKINRQIPEIIWLKFLLLGLIWGGFFLLLLKIWGVAQTGFHTVINLLVAGFQIGDFKIVPLNIGWGILFFILLSAATRIFRTHIVKNTDIKLDKGNKEALASIIGYIGFSIAMILGLLIAGVNFSGLALIAGALSVGIGFGLQNIVSNFISGIILLIERPIKPGDRIIVGDTEGYVRRISIRSTHIITLQRSDVIVPNSDLISKQVTNYMLYDTNFKITLSIGIAYGSDTELAKKLLQDIARTHSEIISDRPDQEPMVYFKEFGESSLLFSLWCLVKDVDRKAEVISDLNFKIDKAFRENGIEIAFPQREIRIKQMTDIPQA